MFRKSCWFVFDKLKKKFYSLKNVNINCIEKIAQGIFILATRVQHPY